VHIVKNISGIFVKSYFHSIKLNGKTQIIIFIFSETIENQFSNTRNNSKSLILLQLSSKIILANILFSEVLFFS